MIDRLLSSIYSKPSLILGPPESVSSITKEEIIKKTASAALVALALLAITFLALKILTALTITAAIIISTAAVVIIVAAPALAKPVEDNQDTSHAVLTKKYGRKV